MMEVCVRRGNSTLVKKGRMLKNPFLGELHGCKISDAGYCLIAVQELGDKFKIKEHDYRSGGMKLSMREALKKALEEHGSPSNAQEFKEFKCVFRSEYIHIVERRHKTDVKSAGGSGGLHDLVAAAAKSLSSVSSARLSRKNILIFNFFLSHLMLQGVNDDRDKMPPPPPRPPKLRERNINRLDRISVYASHAFRSILICVD